MNRSRTVVSCLIFLQLALFCLAGESAQAAESKLNWVKLADPPADPLGRECPPGMDATWVYVPQWKGFLLYGGFSPTYSNGGWFFDPDERKWTLLWGDDSLVRNETTGAWRTLLPREIDWSLDRPGPARGRGAVYVPEHERVYLLGGHPARAKDEGLSMRENWYGSTKLGMWRLDPAIARFTSLDDGGPAGIVMAVYDSANRMIVAAPINRKADIEQKDMVTWVLKLSEKLAAADGAAAPLNPKWEERVTPGAPQCRQTGFAYDEKAHKCVLFTDGRTWTYDAKANVWADAKPVLSPPARYHAGLCFDRGRGVMVLHGGVWGRRRNDAFEPKLEGKTFNDTWTYDLAKNEWSELKPAQSPPLTFSARDQFAYDPDRQACVLYDIATGVWALRDDEPRKIAPRTVPLPAPVVKSNARPVLDASARDWQERIKSLKDDSWLETDARVPALGCMNTLYDPASRCIVQVGGCGGPIFSSADDESYHNSVWLFDMEVGRFNLRKAAQTWGPDWPAFRNVRLPAGCTRGHCFDSKRNMHWLIGGNGTPLLDSPREIHGYSISTDLALPAGPTSPREHDGECEQLVYDSVHDKVVLVDTRRKFRTFLFDPATKAWSDGGPAPKPCCASSAFYGYAHRAFDPQIGVICIMRTIKDWMPGDPEPDKPQWAMRTLAYDAGKKQWRDLAPAGQEKIPACNTPGIAYDSRNRAIIMTKGDYVGAEDHSPGIPEGTLYVLDLAKNTWTAGKPASPERSIGTLAYDVNHNIIIRLARGKLQLYRYKGGCPEGAFSVGR